MCQAIAEWLETGTVDEVRRARPSDKCISIDKEDEFLEKSKAQTIATFISAHRRAIIKSAAKSTARQTGIDIEYQVFCHHSIPNTRLTID
jgi:ABC-type metal ion transport system substrate-binding protein